MTRLKVLIVDDEDLARLRMRSLLADCASPAAEVAGEAGSAAEALHWLAANAADLVLLDINMPGLDGLQLAERLRASASPPRIVFVTAHAKLDVFPEFVQPQATVQTEAPGLAPEQVEALITRPVENALNGAGGLDSIRSESIQGLSVITAVFKDGTNATPGILRHAQSRLDLPVNIIRTR